MLNLLPVLGYNLRELEKYTTHIVHATIRGPRVSTESQFTPTHRLNNDKYHININIFYFNFIYIYIYI